MILLIAGGIAAALYLANQDKTQTVIVDNTTAPDKDKKTVVIPNKTEVKKQTPRVYYYSKNDVYLYKSYSVNHLKTTFTNSANAIYEGEQFISRIPPNIFIGTPTGQVKNNMIQVATVLNAKKYTFWVMREDLIALNTYDASKTKPKPIITDIINKYN